MGYTGGISFSYGVKVLDIARADLQSVIVEFASKGYKVNTITPTQFETKGNYGEFINNVTRYIVVFEKA